jgi:hypothetical protein
MKKLFLIIMVIAFVTNHLTAQDIIGRWQENTPELTGGF